MAHLCHVIDCNTAVHPEKLFCLRHWRSLPYRLRRPVNETYRPGQCIDKKSSVEWRSAARAAIDFIAVIEGKREAKKGTDGALFD